MIGNLVKRNNSRSGGSGNTISKTRYTVTYTSWSASANASGYYTYSLTLNPTIGSSPDVYVAGSSDSTQPTDAQVTQYNYVEQCKVNGSTLTLYAKTKPTATFYIWVEGENGTSSSDIVGNVIQPNGAVSGGGETYSTTETEIGTWLGQRLYRKVVDLPTLPNNTTKFFDNLLPANVTVKRIEFYYIMGGYVIPLPFCSPSDISETISAGTLKQNDRVRIYVTTGQDRSSANGLAVIEYTKS